MRPETFNVPVFCLYSRTDGPFTNSRPIVTDWLEKFFSLSLSLPLNRQQQQQHQHLQWNWTSNEKQSQWPQKWTILLKYAKIESLHACLYFYSVRLQEKIISFQKRSKRNLKRNDKIKDFVMQCPADAMSMLFGCLCAGIKELVF